MIDWGVFIEILDVTTRILGAIAIVLIFFMRGIFMTHKELQKRFETHDEVHGVISEKLGHGATHFARVDGDLRHAPTHDDLDEIKRDLSQLKATTAAIQSSTEERARRMEHIEATLDRVLQYHISASKP